MTVEEFKIVKLEARVARLQLEILIVKWKLHKAQLAARAKGKS